MIENVEISVPFEEIESGSVRNYFHLIDGLKGEFLIVQHDDSNFFFLCTPDCGIEAFCKEFDWYIVSKDKFNDRLLIGIGLADKDHLDGELYRVRDEATLQIWRDILHFTFSGDFIRKFFPYTNHFKGKIRLDGSLCFYIHDYYPVSRHKSITTEQKKVSNLVFRFKEGESGALVAKLFSLAISRMPFFYEAKNPILIPIPASTRERHRQRFAKFCYLLSKHLHIADGYRAIGIKEDRVQLKGSVGRDKLSNLSFHAEYIKGKDVFLVDDILTTGQSFIQTKRMLEKMGASAMVGLFLGKTIEQ
jgi:predicted amidophosphoribosyltransferase